MSVQLSKIEWCDLTVNFWEGCTKVSPGCANCYAEDRDQRYHQGAHWGKGAPRKPVAAGPEKAKRMNAIAAKALFCRDLTTSKRGPITEEDRGKEPDRYEPVRPLAFCMSLGDFFDPEVSIEMTIAALNVISQAGHIDWMILTKRPELILEHLQLALQSLPAGDQFDRLNSLLIGWLSGDPPENIALGTSAEDQKRWDQRVPVLAGIPAAARFVSAEPLLGPIDISEHETTLDLVITGGESGAKARPCHPAWIETIHKDCHRTGLAHHHKQWGEWVDTEIVKPPKEWHPTQGRAIFLQEDGTVTGVGAGPKGSRMLWRAGKATAGSEIMELDSKIRKHSHPLLKFPLVHAPGRG